MNMMLSGVSVKDGKQIAYVQFDDGKYSAEGTIPDCKIVKNNGFTDEQVEQLEDYLKRNLTDLKKQAAKINPFSAMMK